MKKQILFLTFFVVAILAGTLSAYAQPYSLPITTLTLDPLSCSTSSLPLHPMPGIPYTYVMDGTSGEEQADTWTWWATKDSTFITAGGLNLATRLTQSNGQLLNVSANYGISSDADTVSITWSPQILSNTLYEGVASMVNFPSPTFVVGYATGVECADNIEVFEINPMPAFIVDIANIDVDGNAMAWDADTASCVSPVYSAIYKSNGDSLLMNYGWDTLYFEVAAQNFVTSYTPVFTLVSGLTDSQEATIGIASSLANAEAGTFLATAEPIAVGDSTSFGGIELTSTTAGDEVTGVSAWVRVVIANNTYESLSSQPFILAVDGVDLTDQWDLEDTNCDTYATVDYDMTDLARHIVTPRPTLNMNGGEMGEPNTADPDNVIDKQRN